MTVVGVSGVTVVGTTVVTAGGTGVVGTTVVTTRVGGIGVVGTAVVTTGEAGVNGVNVVVGVDVAVAVEVDVGGVIVIAATPADSVSGVGALSNGGAPRHHRLNTITAPHKKIGIKISGKNPNRALRSLYTVSQVKPRSCLGSPGKDDCCFSEDIVFSFYLLFRGFVFV